MKAKEQLIGLAELRSLMILWLCANTQADAYKTRTEKDRRRNEKEQNHDGTWN